MGGIVLNDDNVTDELNVSLLHQTYRTHIYVHVGLRLVSQASSTKWKLSNSNVGFNKPRSLIKSNPCSCSKRCCVQIFWTNDTSSELTLNDGFRWVSQKSSGDVLPVAQDRLPQLQVPCLKISTIFTYFHISSPETLKEPQSWPPFMPVTKDRRLA